MTDTPNPTIAAAFARAAKAARSAARVRPDVPVGDPLDDAERETPATPANPVPKRGPRLVPDVLGAVLESAETAGPFTTFARAMRVTGLTRLPDDIGPFTLFAPTNRAFAKLPADQLGALFQHKSRLARVVTNHLVPREVKAPRAGAPTLARSVDGGDMTVTVEDGVFRVNGARLVKPHIHASNGTVRGIDTVLMPF